MNSGILRSDLFKKYIILGFIGILAGLLFIRETYILSIFSTVLIMAIAALGYNILFGYAGQISLGHGAFLAIGAYTSALMQIHLHTPFYVNIFIVILFSALLGLIIGIPALRLKGFYLAIATMAFGVAVEQILAAVNLFGKHDGLFNIPLLAKSDLAIYLINLTFYLFMVFIARRIIDSPLGLKYKMVRDSETAAKAYGVNLSMVKLNAFIVSAIFGGIAGALYAHTKGYISPGDFGLSKSINLLSIVIIGGTATIQGGFIGSIIIEGVPFFLSRTNIPMSIFVGILLIVFVLFFPKGLAFGFSIAWKKYLQIPFIMLIRFWLKKHKPDGQYLDLDGKKIFYKAKGDGQPIVFIHGNTASSFWWDNFMDLPGYRTYAFDMVNFGYSDRGKSSEIDYYTQITFKFLDKLNLSSVVLVAHSLGGAVAMNLCLDHPGRVKKLLLLDGAPADGLHTPEEAYPIFELYKTDWFLFKKAIQSVVPTLKNQKLLFKLVSNAYLMNPDSYAAHGRTLDKFDIVSKCDKFSIPTLYILGKYDLLITEEMARKTVDLLKGELRVIDICGHSLNIENPELFRKILLEFAEKQ